MKNDNIDELFKDLNFDNSEPEKGHRDRFSQKLQDKNPSAKKRIRGRSLWAPFTGIAAGLALLVFLGGTLFNSEAMEKSGDLASVSPEMKQTQEFYTSLIESELKEIQEEKSPETEAIVKDALKQMEKLDTEYAKLKKDLLKSGKDNRVIYAMINNFQQRIDLLNTVLTQIEEIKQLKNQNHENNII
ncbi:DUF4179 domain-containing protein [Salegentibacter sp. F188]|uniref:DUF4179 domain-containing protein n=1 Tax=Autumnicola patrickiae TaxID=3075591 RepID=A0ABU3E780_9FLAO|nr:DUF4179 domain-containing protein [Salegentibacter sp. F188]MDT0691795.1 DUF4179 domain-containing protein [Salegentibacter sp. F188]